MSEPASKNEPGKGISRRNFIRSLPFLIAGGYAGLKGLEIAFYKSISMGIEAPLLMDRAIDKALQVSEGAEGSENPNFRPMKDVLKEGIDQYQESSKKPVFFARTPGFKGVEHYADTVGKYPLKSIGFRNPGKQSTEVSRELPESAFEAYFQSLYTNDSFEELFTMGSGFERRFRASHPELVDTSGLFVNSDKVDDAMRGDAKREIWELKNKIENQRKEQGTPVSASFVFAHFLGKNEGDVALSIFDAAIFLKFMARNNYDTGNFSPDQSHVEWYRQNIKDEYQGPSYMGDLNPEEFLNLIGKPYHSWNIAALLQFLPVEIVQVGDLKKQLDTLKTQGIGKTRGDLQTLGDLREIESLLLSYQNPRLVIK